MVRPFPLLPLLPLLLFFSSLSTPLAASIKSPPKVKIGSGSAIGSTSDGIDSWTGIQYAQPPIGSLRLLPPKPISTFSGTREFLKQPDSCFNVNSTVPATSSLTPTQAAELSRLLSQYAATDVAKVSAANINNSTATQSEDCLYLNVYRPSGTTKKLPVVVWVYGGSFTSSDVTEYRPQNFVKRSQELSQEVIFVEMNYRLGAYGFLSGQDVIRRSATNNGLLDQRQAFEWVKEHIASFGGDPDRITLWGQSAGAISLGLHLVSHGKTSSEGLYRSMILESGAPIRLEKSSSEVTYSQMTNLSGCDSSADKFKCLQMLPAEDFNSAMNGAATPGPVVDGDFIPDYPDQLVRSGKFAQDVAVLSGSEDDEGTLLTLGLIQSITDEVTFEFFLRSSIAGLSESQYARIKSLYPSTPSVGAPYGTGNQFNITGQNKRVSSIFGDYAFQYPRRSLISKIASSKKSGVFSYLHATYKSTPLLGAYHGSELVNTFGWMDSSISDEMTARWIGFINNQVPNAKGYSKFPNYTTEEKKLLYFGEEKSQIKKDDFRQEQTDYFESIMKNVK